MIIKRIGLHTKSEEIASNATIIFISTFFNTAILLLLVTFFYGLYIPLLFPIAAFTFFNFYISEKYLLAYFFRKPPMLDDALNKLVLNMMRWAPIVFLIMGYWAMGNK